MPFNLPIGHKYSFIALVNAGVAKELRDPIDLGDGLWALFEAPFELDEAWSKWLGSIQSDQLRGCTLVLLAHQTTGTPAILDKENEDLTQRVLSLFYALFLIEVFHQEGGLILTGANQDGNINVRQATPLADHYRPARVKTARLDRVHLLRSASLASGMRAVHTSGGQHGRLRRGFDAFARGIQEYYGAERLHQFVRAVEAVILPATGRSRRQFVDRCQLFAGTSQNGVALLGELYDLRSQAEHLNPLDQALGAYPLNEHERIALLRAYQAQLLASHVYQRVYSDQGLQRLLATDNDIAAFWATRRAQQVQAWSAPVDLDALAATRFRP